MPPTAAFDLPTDSVRTWTVPAVRGAIDLAEQGALQDVADLSEYMRRDSAFESALERRVHGLLRCPFRIVPYTASKRDTYVADCVRRYWTQMAPEKWLRQWVESYHLLDFAPASIDQEFVIDDDGDTWMVPVMRWRNPRYFYWDPSRVTWVDISWQGLMDVDVESGRYMLATTWHMGKFGGKVAALGEDWIDKAFARRDFADWRDLYAWPAIKGIVPAGGSDDNDEKAQFAQSLQQSVRNRIIVVQRDAEGRARFDAEKLVLADGEEYKAFLDIIEYVDRKYQVAFLGGNVASEVVDQGARATAQTQLISEVRLVQADNALLCQVLRDQLIRFFVTLNFGADCPCPFVGWDVGVAEDNKAFAQGMEAFTKALSNVPNGYVIDNIQEIAEKFGIRMRLVDTPSAPPSKLTAPTPDAHTKPQEKPQTEERGNLGGDEECDVDLELAREIARSEVEADPSLASLKRRTIRKVGESKWRVYSKTGKNLGTFSSLAAAKKRLAQVEYFKNK